jgi:hypothetical protein
MNGNRHNNAGPKFGIDLFGGKVRAVQTLTDFGEVNSVQDLLHIPTPWHGCIVELHGDSQLYMTKAHVVKSAIESRIFEGSWTAEVSTDGALYQLRDLRSPRASSSSASSTADTSISSLCEEKSQAAVQVDAISVDEYRAPSPMIRSRSSLTRYVRFLYLKCRTLFGMCFGAT